MIDYAAVLDDLASKRAAACNLFDGVITGIRLLVSASPAPAEVAPPRKLIRAPKLKSAAAKVQRPAATPKATKPAASRPGKVSPADWERARKWWAEGISGPEIGTRIGCTDAGVYFHARTHKWPKRANARKAAPAKPAKQPAGETTPTRICDSCQLRTTRDPCEHCRTKWKRTER